jgi:hypothetical protein
LYNDLQLLGSLDPLTTPLPCSFANNVNEQAAQDIPKIQGVQQAKETPKQVFLEGRG